MKKMRERKRGRPQHEWDVDCGDGKQLSGDHKQVRFESTPAGDILDRLPDDLVILILCKLAASAACASDLVSVTVTCKRLNGLGLNPLVLCEASSKSLTVRARNWSESARRFLMRCCDAGNLEACYILGMIMFYCMESRESGAALMAKAAQGSHMSALFSLAVINFNGSGGLSKNNKNPEAGVAFCFRAASLGHIEAIRELGHCLLDGYGVQRNVPKGRHFINKASIREVTAVLASGKLNIGNGSSPLQAFRDLAKCPLLSGNILTREPHPVNGFLVEWFGVTDSLEAGLRLCSHPQCGLPETRRHEFRHCSVCRIVNYCSRACQTLHWRLAHKSECVPVVVWLDAAMDQVVGD